MTECVIRLDGLALDVGAVRLMDRFHLQVNAGEHVALMGPSGSGKSSLLNLIAGRLSASAGSVAIQGPCAFIHQDLRLVQTRSALGNVMDGARGRLGWWRARKERARAEQLLDELGLAARIHERVDRLSGGEQQRVAIARALMREPKILLADEPTASLDAASAQATMALLDGLRKRHPLTVLSVLHDDALAERYTDRSIRLGAQAAMPTGSAVPESGARKDAAGLAQAGGFAQSMHGARDRSAVSLAWSAAAVALVALLCAWAVSVLQLQWPDAGVSAQLWRFGSALVPSAEQWATMPYRSLWSAVLDTLLMAWLATVMAIVVALPLSALAARSLAPIWIAMPIRALLNALRAIPSLLWALLAVGAFGLGPLAGILALAFYSMGYLTKFFYEHFEAVDPRVPQALRDLGLSRSLSFLLADLPAARLGLLSSMVFMLEYNFRTATVLGIVGAGGIGYELKTAVDWGNWHVVGAILVVLMVAVIIFDSIAARLRRALA